MGYVLPNHHQLCEEIRKKLIRSWNMSFLHQVRWSLKINKAVRTGVHYNMVRYAQLKHCLKLSVYWRVTSRSCSIENIRTDWCLSCIMASKIGHTCRIPAQKSNFMAIYNIWDWHLLLPWMHKFMSRHRNSESTATVHYIVSEQISTEPTVEQSIAMTRRRGSQILSATL